MTPFWNHLKLLSAALYLFACLITGCPAQVCPGLPIASFSSLIYNGSDVTANQPTYTANDSVEYLCAVGYRLHNSSGALQSQPETICQSNMTWTLRDVLCIAYDCGSLPTVANGDVLVSATANGDMLVSATANGDVQVYATTFGSTANYSCNSGYSLSGSTVFCSLTGWSPAPQCEKTPPLSEQEIITILAAVLGPLCLILIILITVTCCRVCRLQTRSGNYLADDEVSFARERGAFSLSSPVIGLKNEDSASNPLYLTPDEMTDFEQKN